MGSLVSGKQTSATAVVRIPLVRQLHLGFVIMLTRLTLPHRSCTVAHMASCATNQHCRPTTMAVCHTDVRTRLQQKLRSWHQQHNWVPLSQIRGIGSRGWSFPTPLFSKVRQQGSGRLPSARSLPSKPECPPLLERIRGIRGIVTHKALSIRSRARVSS